MNWTPFNRTRMELKHREVLYFAVLRPAFNRTRMELKLKTGTGAVQRDIILLTVPEWN